MAVRTAGILLLASLLSGFGRPARPPCPTCGSSAAARSSALKGVWLSIESPANPHDAANQGVLLLVHTFWMRGPAAMTVEGRAEGAVDGQRRTVPLAFEDRGGGVYALSPTWPADGRWVLVITGRNRGQQATAVVRLSEDRTVANVQVTPDGRVAEAEVAAALR